MRNCVSLNSCLRLVIVLLLGYSMSRPASAGDHFQSLTDPGGDE